MDFGWPWTADGKEGGKADFGRRSEEEEGGGGKYLYIIIQHRRHIVMEAAAAMEVIVGAATSFTEIFHLGRARNPYSCGKVPRGRERESVKRARCV